MHRHMFVFAMCEFSTAMEGRSLRDAGRRCLLANPPARLGVSQNLRDVAGTMVSCPRIGE